MAGSIVHMHGRSSMHLACKLYPKAPSIPPEVGGGRRVPFFLTASAVSEGAMGGHTFHTRAESAAVAPVASHLLGHDLQALPVARPWIILGFRWLWAREAGWSTGPKTIRTLQSTMHRCPHADLLCCCGFV
jgi:hypothetical protein